MNLIEYLSKLDSLWKITLGLLILCIFPLSAYIIFHYHINLVARLDTFKLLLLTCAMTSPFLIVNAGLVLLTLYPGNKDLRKQRDGIDILPATGFISVCISAIIFSIGSLMAFLDAKHIAVEITMASIQVIILLILVYSAIRERA